MTDYKEAIPQEHRDDLVEQFNTAKSIYEEIKLTATESKLDNSEMVLFFHELHVVFMDRLKIIADQWFDAHLADVVDIHDEEDKGS